MSKLEKVQEFLVGSKSEIDLILLGIKEGIDIINVRTAKYPEFKDDLQLLDMSGIIEFNYSTNLYELTTKVEFKDELEEYRTVFGYFKGETLYGLKRGTLGDLNKIKKNLRKFFKENTGYSMRDVINTAKAYVNQERQNNYKYLQAADYFIYKDGRSRLASLIDEFKNYESKPSTNWFN